MVAMKRTISLPRLQEVVRARVCAHCERLTPGGNDLPLDQARDCEHGCGLFESLPNLRTLAVNLDPVVGHLDRAARVACGPVVDTRKGRQVMATLRELTGR
jgi:hypothetical protein